ncbi:MAG: M56 family metallopeptidase [Bacteroidales bacterium]
METVYIYFLKASIALILFYGFYRLVIFQNTFFKVRRFTLLAIIAFSLTFPFIRFSLQWDQSNGIISAINEGISVNLPEIIVSGHPDAMIPVAYLLPGIYALVTGIMLLRILIGLFSVVRLRMLAQKEEMQGINVLRLPAVTAPFSFFGWIFFYPEKENRHETAQILLHELTHVRQYHSIDTLICELLTAFFWFNPFAWLLKREVRVNLELLADEKVIRSGAEIKSYQYALLRLCHPVKTNKLVNNFNVSQFKRRIMMMNKNRSSRNSLLRYAFVLPVALVLVIACNSREEELTDEQIIQEQKVASPISSVREGVDDVFTVAEEMPQYPGGTDALLKFIGDNIKYPASAEAASIEGRVIASFVVTKEGKIKDINIIRGVVPELDEEAIRVIESMPDWTPGYQRGQAVNVKYTIPIHFRLQ